MASNKIAIIIPAFNEETTINFVIKEIFDLIDDKINIIVVSDCSSDNTASVANESGAIVLELTKNHGYAGAINEGLSHAIAKLDVDYLITMDADGQHDPKSVKILINRLLVNDIDLVVGKRQYTARFSEKLYSLFFKIYFKINDPLCGLKGYKKSIYLEYGTFETFDSIGTELLTWALINNKNVSQIPVKIRSREDSPRFGSGLIINLKILKSLTKTIAYILINKLKN
ncbi:glycosyltransferase family 2 protein [Shewanella metallivivens]|uniref:Glycosyltransferase family 2 protein n=1 Tax=Shewanella metallivivens TaxID=2872342 RepID=A0ABT5TJ72_9GAMM|nr:glycosyltransferase family 2 protein [Shewanella metallivivens]MDD8058643.1 glycosyltransferase family 2 protein [Shewanella metallivivens]